jgi:hypothetical protein
MLSASAPTKRAMSSAVRFPENAGTCTKSDGVRESSAEARRAWSER